MTTITKELATRCVMLHGRKKYSPSHPLSRIIELAREFPTFKMYGHGDGSDYYIFAESKEDAASMLNLIEHGWEVTASDIWENIDDGT